jgi:hypothetical protein
VLSLLRLYAQEPALRYLPGLNQTEQSNYRNGKPGRKDFVRAPVLDKNWRAAQ